RGDDLVRDHPARAAEGRPLEGPAIADPPLGLRDRFPFPLGRRLVYVERTAGRQQSGAERDHQSQSGSGWMPHFSVSIRPLTNHRWPTTTMATGGSRASITVAITRFHSAAASPVGSTRLIPMTIVSMLSSVVIMSGQRYWFQPKMNRMTN